MNREDDLHPDARAVLELARAAGRPPFYEMTLEQARAAGRASRVAFGAEPPATRIREFAVPGPGGQIAVRMVRPLAVEDDVPLPLFLFLHGGGWVVGDLDNGDWLCASLVDRLGIAVVTVDYRLAPEHPFPAAINDSLAVQDWLFAEAPAIGVDSERIAVGGDSAGGNLAAVCALHARDAGQVLRAQLLLYPVVDCANEHPSYERNGEGFMLTAETMRWFRHVYVGGADPGDWRLSPIRAASLAGVAPALVVSCGFDPLCDEAAAYAEALERAGVAVRHRHFPGQLHGFAMWSKVNAETRDVLDLVTDELRTRLAA